ncbi:related to LEO1 Extremely hydrophilic protein [Phialocephala subalpina]|uniref:Related to LEO1 Extremely hydrophilic protein n=1 Tax=Phialocephala subalpina TaxID=576137 RepID=A0A1L7X831_9HELO|nr:related to LEO1 Extremely hydrophilic protein [Phialocephala subalpina]
MSSEEDDIMDTVLDGSGDEDLFGGDDEDAPVEKTRELSDRELDSGDDEDRNDRAPLEEEIDYDGGRDARVMDTTVWRHPLPKPADGEYSYLRLPTFLGIEPRAYDASTFRVPESDHHAETRSANFSASAVSASTMRYRKDPSTGKLESNTNIYRWSDGSTTISVGDQHYELQSKPLAPPRGSKTYSETQDSHFYLATPSIASQLLLLVGHMSNQHTVRPNKDIEDDALEKLQKSLAAAARRGNKDDKGPELVANTEDPELQKKRAEIAEKERMRAQRRRETAAEKASQAHRPGGGRSGGLSLDDLEGRSGRRAPASGRKPPKPRKRRPDYDSDDDLPKGRSREDEYDMEDDFLAPSDDEEAPEGDDDEDEEEILDDESERDEPKAKKQKVSRQEDVSDADADAEADLDDEEAPAAPVVAEAAGRGRKRNIIEDDDDDDE